MAGVGEVLTQVQVHVGELVEVGRVVDALHFDGDRCWTVPETMTFCYAFSFTNQCSFLQFPDACAHRKTKFSNPSAGI